MVLKDRIRQIIELLATGLAVIPLPLRLVIVKASFADLARTAPRAADPLRPAQFTDFSVALGIINQFLDLQHLSQLSFIVWFASAYGFSSPFAYYLLEFHIEPTIRL